HRSVCATGSRARGVADGHVHAAGVVTHRSGWHQRCLPMEREHSLLGADGGCLGGCGFLPRSALARRTQALGAQLRSARQPTTTLISRGCGSALGRRRYTRRPSADTSYVVPQCPKPIGGTATATGGANVGRPSWVRRTAT